MAISSYNTDPALNISVGGADISEGCNPDGVNDAVRQIMADLAAFDTTDFSRAITVPPGETGSNVPSVVNRASKVLLFDSLGNAGASAFGTVYAGTEAVVADNRTILANMSGVTANQVVVLTEPGREGVFKYAAVGGDAAKIAADTNQGIYVPSVIDATKVWVRILLGPVNPCWFGISTAATAAANTAAWATMRATLKARAVVSGGYASLGHVRFPDDKDYNFNTIDIFDGSLHVEGFSLPTPSSGTHLIFPAGQTGFRFQRFDTSGASGITGSGVGGDNSLVERLRMTGGYTGTEGEFHGMLVRAHSVAIRDNVINGFEGDGIRVDTLAGGNANCFAFARNTISGNRNGIYTVGGNSNAGSGRDNDVSSNRQWGVWDNSFLGNTWHGIAENCGLTVGATPTLVSNSGNRYAVVAGQEAGASTNAPSGTIADNTWWYYVGVGGTDVAIPAWVSGITVRAGGPIRTSNNNARNVIIGFYSEVNQGPMQLVWPTLLLGGSIGSGVRGVSWLRHSDSSLVVDNFHVLGNTILGPANNDPPANATTWFATTSSFHNCLFGHWTGASTVTYGGSVQSEKNVAFRIIGNPKIEFYAGDPIGGSVYAGKVGADGFDLLNKLLINGQKVVGTRQIAVGHSTVTAAASPTTGEFNDLVVRFNALVDRLGATSGHGLTSD